jgi:osmotically inducible lipoprotein OsmB
MTVNRRSLIFCVLAAGPVAACARSTTTEQRIGGAAVGAGTGALVGGPIGAVVGGAAGAVAAPTVVRSTRGRRRRSRH